MKKFNTPTRAAVAVLVSLVVGLTHAVAAENKERVLEGENVQRVDSESQVSLTFDEPLGSETRPILRILDRFDAKATFFVVGREAEENPGLVEAILARGHEIGNHTWNHADMTEAPQPRRSMRRTQQSLEALTGEAPVLFRPPYGAFDEATIRSANGMGMTFVTWSVVAHEQYLYWDWIVLHVTNNLEPGDIVLLHQVESVRKALPGILEHIEERGWESTTISNLLAGQPG